MTRAHIHLHGEPRANLYGSRGDYLHITVTCPASVVVASTDSRLDSRVADEVMVHLEREHAEALVREIAAALEAGSEAVA